MPHATLGVLPNKAMHLTALRAAGDRQTLGASDDSVTKESLIAAAAALARPFTPSPDCTSGTVAAALVTASGNTYTGVCVDAPCGLGFCAEHAAIARMLEAREANVAMIVAVTADGKVIPPCGRCRELLWQISPANQTTWVVLGNDSGCPLTELLPHR